jgi:hypothetical protein
VFLLISATVSIPFGRLYSFRDYEPVPQCNRTFYRVDKARSRGDGGSGLGLAIAQYIAAAHGASIEVESELGRGSRFVVTFPALTPAGDFALFTERNTILR